MHNEAIYEFNKAIELDSSNSEYYLSKIESLQCLNRNDEALEKINIVFLSR